MFRIAICDDDKTICNHIDQMIANYTRENKLHIETEVFYSGEDLCRHLNAESQFDLIFLDIEMTVMSGIDVGYETVKREVIMLQSSFTLLEPVNILVSYWTCAP